MENSIKYNVTTDEQKLDRFFMENDLEYSDEHPVETDRVKCWEVLDGDKLIGGACLALRQGEYILDGIAVDSDYRGKDIGRQLLMLVLDETKERGGEKVFLVARAPEFFAHYGFTEVAKEDAPNFFECLTCPQFGVTCHPKVMVTEV